MQDEAAEIGDEQGSGDSKIGLLKARLLRDQRGE
jgi:hypothetical protein